MELQYRIMEPNVGLWNYNVVLRNFNAESRTTKIK